MKSNKYEKYKSEHIREKNKIKRITKHIKKHPNDRSQLDNIERIKLKIKQI